MCTVKYHLFLFFLLFFECYALNCRSDGGPKEVELKNIYRKCLKMQEGKNSNSSKGSDHDWSETRGYNQKRDWEKDNEDSGRNDKSTARDKIRNGMSEGRDTKSRSNSNDRINSEVRTDSHDRIDGRKRIGSDSMNGRYEGDDYFNNRGGFPQSDELGSDMSQHNYYTPSHPPRRYKREKRPENSGHRSQYNPNSHKISGYEDNRSDEKNSTSREDNSSSRDMDDKSCALHCFLEKLEMTGDDGMPDRYLVTHTLTKDVNNEDLRDFLQEAIEECFQMLDNENTEDKCDFSKNLLMCLSEKGRANCDDWKEDLKF